MALTSLIKEIDLNLYNSINTLGSKDVIERIDIYKINYDEANHPVNVRMYYQWQKSGENSRKPEIEINVNELTDIYSKIENNIPVKGPIEDYKKSALLRSYRGDYNNLLSEPSP